MYENNKNITVDNIDYEMIGDGDSFFQEDTHCGDMIFEYSHIDGVNNNILNDFNVRVDLYTENTNASVL